MQGLVELNVQVWPREGASVDIEGKVPAVGGAGGPEHPGDISGKKNRVRVYYLSWRLKIRILRTDNSAIGEPR